MLLTLTKYICIGKFKYENTSYKGKYINYMLNYKYREQLCKNEERMNRKVNDKLHAHLHE